MTNQNPPRSLEVRLTEYRDNLLSIAAQLDGLVSQLEAAGRGGPQADGLRDGVKLYTLVANDLTKVIAGEDLRPFAVTGEL